MPNKKLKWIGDHVVQCVFGIIATVVGAIIVANIANEGSDEGPQPTAGVETRGLTAGTYTGEVACLVTTRDIRTGKIVEQGTEKAQQTVVISASGTPIQDGEEVLPGSKSTQSMGAITINGKATDVLTSPNGATVKWDVEMILEVGDQVFVLTGTSAETYRSGGQDQINFTASMVVSSADLTLHTLMQQQECSGELSR